MKMKSLHPLFCAAILAFVAAAGAQSPPDADLAEVRAVTLTEASFAKYAEATRNLAAARLDSCDADPDDDANATSVAQMAAKLDSVPAAKAAVQAAGLTSREYIVFSLALLENGFAAYAPAGSKLPAGINPANVAFVRSHQADLDRLGEEMEEPDCGDGAGDDE
jgi:hypothetical protein